MSDNSSNSMDQPDVHFSTDYLVDELQNSMKLVPEHKRKKAIPTNNPSPIRKNNDCNSSNGDSISDYVTPVNNTIKPNIAKSLYNIDTIQEPSHFGNTSKPTQNKVLNNEDEDNYNSLSRDQQYIKKLDILTKLSDLPKSIKLSQKYSINSDYFLMKYEHALHTKNKNKIRTINWMNGALYSIIEGAEIFCAESEFVSSKISLEGWTAKTQQDMDSYTEVFGDLYEKYNIEGKQSSPELRLLFLFFGGAIATAIGNKIPQAHTYTPEEIQKLREKARNDRIKSLQTTKKQQELNNDVVQEIDNREMVNLAKQHAEKKQEELNALKTSFEPQLNDIAKQRHAMLQNMRQNLANMQTTPAPPPPTPNQSILQNNSSDSSNNSANNSQLESSKKSQSIYTKSRNGKKRGITIM